METENTVYLGLGGNIGDTLPILKSALNDIKNLDVVDFKASRFYHTPPVSDLDQAWYINAACRFNTKMEAKELLIELQNIEMTHGKIAKPKNAPRVIDIDLLIFGKERHNDDHCQVPHPRWKERLFVIKPLLDLTPEIIVPGLLPECCGERVNLIELIQTFPDQSLLKCVAE